MSSPSGTEVWNSAIADPTFAGEIPQGSALCEVLRPFIEASPVVLAEFLRRPLTAQTLADAKLAFLRYCLANGFVEKVGEASGMGGKFIQLTFEMVIEMLVDILKDVPAFLKEQGVTEGQIMLSKKVGLNAKNKALYKSGRLTVADVLRTQPSVILKNN